MRKVRLFITMALMAILSVVPVQAAKKKDVNVVTKIEYFEYYNDVMNTIKFKHNKKGLVTEKICTEEGTKTPWRKIKYKYGKNNLVKSATVYEYGSKTASVTYKYNSKKQLTKRKTVYAYQEDSSATCTYKYKKGKLSSVTTQYKNTDIHQNGKTVTTFKFNKKGLPTSITTKDSKGKVESKAKFEYDSKGYMKSSFTKWEWGNSEINRKLKYKKGKLATYKDSETGDFGNFTDTTRTITWKKVSVPKSVSDIVKNQQLEIINGNKQYAPLLGTNTDRQ